ncbi:MAG TPA: hypothetical protein VNE19_05160, partial [Methylomirabilota bacterium]|nr:hypothetical protein [Methylomirabilota bacterium]
AVALEGGVDVGTVVAVAVAAGGEAVTLALAVGITVPTGKAAVWQPLTIATIRMADASRARRQVRVR